MIQEYADVEIWPEELPPPYEFLIQKIKGMDGLLCLLTDKIDDRLMEAAGPSLKVISQYAVGFDNIDIRAATRRGIPVGNTPGVLTDATADFTWALLMSAARRVVEGDRFTRSGRWKTWEPTLLLGPDVAGATLGILGFGRIGQAVARRAHGFDMHILYHDTRRFLELEQAMGVKYVSFDDLLRQSDILTIHTVLSPETRHLFGEEQFKQMKPTSILINTARGPIVQMDALYHALKSGKIAYAALDVTDPEPIPMDSPLLNLENIIIAPHMASASIHSRTRMSIMAAENLIAGLKGEPLPNCVNPEVYPSRSV